MTLSAFIFHQGAERPSSKTSRTITNTAPYQRAKQHAISLTRLLLTHSLGRRFPNLSIVLPLMHRTTLFVDHTRLRILLSLRTILGARNPIDLGGRITTGAAIGDALVPGGFVIAAHFGTTAGQSWRAEGFKGGLIT